jgi:hypothetical protein
MTWHIYAVVTILSNLWQVLVQASYKPELLAGSLVVPIGNVSPLWAKQQSLPLLTLYFSTTGNIDQQEIRAKILNYSVFVWPFYTLIRFSRHIIQI